MAVDLEELVPSLQRAINPPGSELFPDATTGILVGHLSDAFWEGKLDGFYGSYTENDGIVTPESGDTDLSRDWQQLIVFYASMQIISNELRSKNTLFRSQAGPVEFEVQNSAQLLREHLRMLKDRRDYLLEVLSSTHTITPGYVDMLCTRTAALEDGVYHFASSYESGGRLI